MTQPRIHDVNDDFAICAQLTPNDMKLVENSGYRTILNNRPDGEEPGQPETQGLAKAARIEGLQYVSIPVSGSNYTDEAIARLRTVLATAPKPILAFCRTGNRSANLWARASLNPDPVEATALEQALAMAGYDVSDWADAKRAMLG